MTALTIDRCTCGDWRADGICQTCVIREQRDARNLALIREANRRLLVELAEHTRRIA